MLRFIELLSLMVPAYVANMTPPFVKYWPGWNRPISARWLGSHKTVIGFLAGVATGILTTFALAFVQSRTGWARSLVDLSQWPLLGIALGFGAMAGDSLKSLFKRRCHIAPGAPWIPFDQLDFVVGALAMLAFWVDLRVAEVTLILALSFVGDIIVNQIAYRLRIRDTAW